jgi:acetyltransferase (GNAT) family protein/GNAT acetyltransferase-like protein
MGMVTKIHLLFCFAILITSNGNQNRAAQDAKTHFISSGGRNGFLIVASADNPTEAEGCIVPLAYENSTGWIGFFCVNEQYRGGGWGRQLFAAALDHFNKTNTEIVGLDAVQEQVPTYERRGFVDVGRIRLMQHSPLEEVSLTEHVDGIPGAKIVSISEVPQEALIKSDLEHTGLHRSKLWTEEALFSREETFGLALVGEEDAADLKGWIVVRSCQHGYRLGPLYASSTLGTSQLLHSAMKKLQGRPGGLIAEVWMGNPAAVELFAAVGWTETGVDYHRMWLHGKVPKEQDKRGKGNMDMYAIFDAGEG